MKNNIIKYMAGAAMALGLAATVQAAPMGTITGGISMSGTYTVTGGNLGAATSFATFSLATIAGAPTGSYAGLAGDLVALTPFTFGSGTGPRPISVTPLWLTTPGSASYSFDLTSLSVNTHTGSVLDMSGAGTLHIPTDINGNSWTDTPGDWVFTANSLGGTFSFSASNGALMPDGGMTVMLLGAALSGLALIRRKLA
jgi:hypothetical protein